MKKIVSLVLAMSMVLSMFASAFAATSFSDLEKEENVKYVSAVESLVELGVINGLPDGTYGPEKKVTRAQLAKMLVLCLGLGDSAERLDDQQIFTDVPTDEWFAGYVNAAAQAKVITGYPDGSFKPGKNVSYAEAYTMIIRALGYGNVADAEGTWPTSYMLKAVELKLNADVEGDGASDAALRGNVAIMLWNMLKTPMWRIGSESEGDGMTSSTSKKMLSIKFPDYAYEKVLFEGYDIVDGDEEAVVKMSFEGLNTDYEYAKNDFYTFVPGTEVEVLVNEKEDILLTINPTGEDKLVEGEKDVIDDKYDDLKEVAYDYAYAIVEKRAIAEDAVVLLTGSSIYVDKLEEKTDYIKINGTKYEDDEWDYEIVLKDGERVTLRDIEVGDILTTVNVSTGDSFYVIGGTEVEGELTRYSEVKLENSDIYVEQMIIDKEKYPVAEGATYVEDPEEKEVDAEVLADTSESVFEKMKGEEVVAKLDAVFGKVVRVEFDGKIDSGKEEDSTLAFYGVEVGVDKDGRTYNIGLANEEGSDSYEFTKSSDAEAAAKSDYANGVDATGSFAWVELDDEGKLETFTVLAKYEEDAQAEELTLNKVLVSDEKIPYGEGEKEYYAVVEFPEGSFDDDKNAIVDAAEKPALDDIKVNDSTILVNLVFDDKGDDKESNDEFRVEFEEGIEALEVVNEEKVVVIYDADASFIRAKYVVIWSDTSDKSDRQLAKVVSPDEADVHVGDDEICLDDGENDDIILIMKEAISDLYEFVVYTVTTNSKGEEIFNFVAGLHTGELSLENSHGYVGETLDGRVFLLNNEEETDIDDEQWEKYEDYMVVLVNVSETEETEGQYEVDSFETVDFLDVTLKEGDRLSFREDADQEVIFVIRGMEKIKAE